MSKKSLLLRCHFLAHHRPNYYQVKQDFERVSDVINKLNINTENAITPGVVSVLNDLKEECNIAYKHYSEQYAYPYSEYHQDKAIFYAQSFLTHCFSEEMQKIMESGIKHSNYKTFFTEFAKAIKESQKINNVGPLILALSKYQHIKIQPENNAVSAQPVFK